MKTTENNFKQIKTIRGYLLKKILSAKDALKAEKAVTWKQSQKLEKQHNKYAEIYR